MRTASRIDYDAIAHLYDRQPHRAKVADPELTAFLERRAGRAPAAILDIACGTGSQLVANRSATAGACLVGLDRSLGMLRQARSKAMGLAWVLGDAALLPFHPASFDFITCQFGFHHIADKTSMLCEVFRVLRRDGRFVMRNLCPQEQPDWLYYDYFPEAQTIDLADFWPPERIAAAMTACGFSAVGVEPEHLRFAQDLRAWLEMVRHRASNSQLMAISDAAYAAGISRLEREANDPHAPQVRSDHLCLVTIRGEKPV